jgi:hypothetical protein
VRFCEVAIIESEPPAVSSKISEISPAPSANAQQRRFHGQMSRVANLLRHCPEFASAADPTGVPKDRWLHHLRSEDA